jgi:hypothetical protein
MNKKYRTITTFETFGDDVPTEHDTLDEAIECALSSADTIVELMVGGWELCKRDGDYLVFEEQEESASNKVGYSHEIDWWDELFKDAKDNEGKLPIDKFRIPGSYHSVIDRLVATAHFNGEVHPIEIQKLNEESGEYDSPEFQAYERGKGFGDNRTIRVKW